MTGLGTLGEHSQRIYQAPEWKDIIDVMKCPPENNRYDCHCPANYTWTQLGQ